MFVVFAVCAIPVHIWLVINFLDQARGIFIRVNTWDFVGVVSYILTYALLESVLVFFSLLLLAFLLPGRLFRNKFVALSFLIMFFGATWFVYLHYNDDLIGSRQLISLAVWVFSLFAIIVLSSLIIHRVQKLETSIVALSNRLAVLALLYVFVDLLGVAIVVFRNI